MDRRSFLSKVLCLGAVAAIVPKIIPKVFPDHLYIFSKGNIGLTPMMPPYKLDVNGTDRVHQYPLTKKECYSPIEILKIWRETGNLLSKPPEWATHYQFVYPLKI